MNVKKIVIIGTGAVVVLLIAVVITLKALFPAERLKAIAQAELEKAVNRKVDPGEVSFQVIGGLGVQITGLKVADRTEFASSGTEFLSLDQLLLHVKFWPLLERQLVVDQLTLVGLHIKVHVDQNGVANYADLAKADTTTATPPTDSAKSQPFSLQASAITIRDGDIQYQDDQNGTRLGVGNLNYETSLAVESGTRIKADGILKLGDITVQRPQGPITGLDAQLVHKVGIDTGKQSITVDALNLTFQKMGLALKGRIADYSSDTTHVDLTIVSSDITIEQVIASLPPDLVAGLAGATGSGKIGIEGAVRGPISNGLTPDITAAITLRDGGLQTPDVPVPFTAITGDIAVHNTTATVKNLSLKAGASDIALTGTVAPLYGGGRNSRPHANVTITSQFLNIDEISPPITDPAKIKPYTPLPDLILTGTANAAKVKVSGLALGNVHANVAMQDQVVRLTDLSAVAYGGKITGTVIQDLTDVKHPKVVVDTRIELMDVADILSPILPVKNLLSGKLSTSFGASTTLDSIGNPSLNILSALGSLGIDGGRVTNFEPLRKLSGFLKIPDVEKIDFRTLTGAFQIADGRVSTQGLQVSGGPTEWLAVGSAGLDGTLDYQLKLTFSPALTAKVGNSLAGNALSFFKDPHGRAGVTLKVGGTLTDPKFSWDSSGLKQQVTAKVTQEAQKLFQDHQQKLLGSTPLKSLNADTLKQQAGAVLKTAADSVKTDLGGKAKNALKGLFK